MDLGDVQKPQKPVPMGIAVDVESRAYTRGFYTGVVLALVLGVPIAIIVYRWLNGW